jgi:hypothetical protein
VPYPGEGHCWKRARVSTRIREALRVAVLRRDNEKDPTGRATLHARVTSLRESLGLRTMLLADYEAWLAAVHARMVARAGGRCPACGGMLRGAHGMGGTLTCTGCPKFYVRVVEG